VSDKALPAYPAKLFKLPTWMTDAAEGDKSKGVDPDLAMKELVDMHEVLVKRFQAEAAHIPMNTVQQLLIERMATHYVFLRWKEGKTKDGQMSGFDHGRDFKDQNTFWLAMTQEFNRLLKQYDPNAPEKQAERLANVLEQVFAGMHVDVAGPLRERFGEALESAGL
jgi:hypothetical protein